MQLDRVISNMIYDYVGSSTTYATSQNRGRNLENRGLVTRRQQKNAAKYNAIVVLTKIQKSNTDKESNLPSISNAARSCSF